MAYGGIGPLTSTDPGHDNPLTDTAAHQFGSQPCANGVATFSCPLANTAAVYLGRSSAVTTGVGIELQPGDSRDLPCQNTNEWFAITGIATQHVHAVSS